MEGLVVIIEFISDDGFDVDNALGDMIEEMAGWLVDIAVSIVIGLIDGNTVGI